MFQDVTPLPPDPLLGISIAFAADNNPQKVDLGVGMYKDEAGRIPIFGAVKAAERELLEVEQSKSYLGSSGSGDYNRLMRELIFSADLACVTEERVASIQTPGGCGALRVAAEFIKRCRPDTTVWMSDPTWANHEPLLGDAGVKLRHYPYYDQASASIRFDAMMDTLAQVPAGDVVLLHGCCHNPSGADLNREQWQAVAELAEKNGFLVFIDLAYQGFGQGLDDDAWGVRLLADRLPELVVASSCSKNFGLYRERTGSLCVVTEAADTATAVQTHLNKIVRGIYSMPPAHGAAIVETILGKAALKQAWTEEVEAVCGRIRTLRVQFADALQSALGDDRFRFIQHQSGMFSFLGISPQQVDWLREQYSVYMAGSSRVNVAGLTPGTMEYVASAVAECVEKE